MNPAGDPPNAQAPSRLPRIGYLSGFHSDSPAPLGTPHLQSFLEGLAQAGYVDQYNVEVHYRFAYGELERLPALAAELVELPVDVIMTSDSQAMGAARSATSVVPLVTATSSDPVGNRVVASLAQPGGNVTGLTLQTPDLVAKRVQLVRLAIPTVERIGILWRRTNAAVGEWTSLEAVCQELGIEAYSLEIRDPSEIDAALLEGQAAAVDAILVFPTPSLNTRQVAISARARELTIPLIGAAEEWAEAGALMSYSPSLHDLFRRAAGYVDRILKGAEPGQLPIERPRRFDLVLNLRTADALGISLDPGIFDLATRVIR